MIDGLLSIYFTNSVPQKDNPKISGIEVKFLSPHFAHSVSNGPYKAVDTDNDGSAIVTVDGSFSHTHGAGLDLVQYIWKEGSVVLGQSAKANFSLPVGEHTITLTVKDSGSHESTDVATVTVNPFNFPALAGVSPSSGSVTGGQVVTLTGSGFTYLAGQTKVKFGLVELTGAAIQVINQSTIQLTTPAAVVGSPVSVTVETPLATSNAMTYTYEAASPVAFTSGMLTAFGSPTAVAFGPDGKLYVGTLQGSLAKLTLDDSYTQVVNSVVSVVTQYRAILGITFDPLETSGNPGVYITSSYFFHGGTNSSSGQGINGKISRVSGANLDFRDDIITGLPVSDSDHGTYGSFVKSAYFVLSMSSCSLVFLTRPSLTGLDGLEFGDNGEIYIQVGSNTNGGVPGQLTGKQVQKDNYYSASTVVAHLADPLFNGAITYDAADDGTPNGGYGIEVFAAGLRNPFGVTLHSNGNLYCTDNGPNLGFGSMMTGCGAGQFVADIQEGDKLNLLVKGNFYGAPNRKRALATNDARQCVWHSQNEPSHAGYTAPILKATSSIDGLIEFQGDHFDGQLRGNLIAARYQGPLFRIILSPDGSTVIPQSDPAIQLTEDVEALDVTQAPDGTLISSSLGNNAITFHKPNEQPTTVLQVKSVFPRRGGRAGGNTLKIFGVNFGAAQLPTVTMGGSVCVVATASATKIECTVPLGSTGTVDVVVTAGGQTYTFRRGYRYITGLPLPP